MRGAFITFEGGEGAGKSTQAERLADRLREAGHAVTLTREPGGSPWAERLREALLSDRGRGLDATQQAILFAAARADHVETVIAPALRAGQVVICDRFSDSTEAYQGSLGAPQRLLALLRIVAVGSLMPDLTLILDVPPDVGRARAEQRTALDAFERDEEAVQTKRRDAFLAIAAREPERCAVIDASGSPDDVAQRIDAAVAERLGVLDGS
ncbi:dTMP kinase [Acuticoccus mangrovi]|uniref:Thymidylate kinase n=1 Tax=Acuticoccus mangrovi TaxID=2796142 RepID=A0A934ILQ4_9HYPH|nr:dTMP kinase [Acuticoccus mangrovi]MBJ3774711.1 dTMP kinase [Acuticoccus mangrovi]